jgi:hypothetical protein
VTDATRDTPIILVAALAAGCGPNTPAPTAGPIAIELKPVTVADFDGFVASQKGKVVLIDCWFLN